MDFFQQITSQTTILTPNRRLSAAFLKKYSQWQVAQGHSCWQTLDILPLYPSWLQRTWQNYSAREFFDDHLLLTIQQEQLLWEKILREAPENEYLLHISDTAKLAKSAWEILKRWRVKLNDTALTLTEDSRAFHTWGMTFETLLQQNSWIDQNSLADMIAEKIIERAIIPPPHIILIGFTELAPQYQYLLKICEQYHSKISYYEMPSQNQTSAFIGLMDTETEIRSMARWAKATLQKSNSIGCIIPNLESIRESVIQIFQEVVGEHHFNISAGKSLITYPIIHDALQFLHLHRKNLSLNSLHTILSSPFIGEAEREKNKRALFDTRLRNANISTISLQQLIDPKEKYNLMNAAPALAERLITFSQQLQTALTKKCPISQWVTVFNDLLKILGWPGERSLNSHEYQVVKNSWLPLLSQYATIDNILAPQSYQNALHYLKLLATHTMFQPESPDTSIQILGLLEAADIPFEYSWIMGLDDTAWPSRPKPNPFIPLRLQNALNMPNANAERELVYCQTLTTQLKNSAQHLIVSYPQQCDDAELRPSSLIKHFNKITLDQINLITFTPYAENIFRTQQLDYFQDDIAPPLPQDEEVSGGVKIFKSQAECPFKAFAEIRLHAQKIEEPILGLRKVDRGNDVHKALELIWRELKDSQTLITQSDEELKLLIHQSAKIALQDMFESSNNKKYLELELQRLEKLLWSWLQIEKNRPSFKVLALEQELSTRIGHIKANFRIDRIDTLLSPALENKQLIIDYKTGKSITQQDWFGPRLNEPQLPIYCLANPENTTAIAFAKLNPEEMKMIGASQSSLETGAIIPLADIQQADSMLWDEQINIWQHHLEKLSHDFSMGKAQVDPKNAAITCRHCGLKPLCRIHEISQVNEDYDDKE